MSNIFIYSNLDDTNDYNTNGYGMLSDILLFKTESELNGQITTRGEYVLGGELSEYIVNNAIIKAKINQYQKEQLMRIYNVKTDINNHKITFNAEPIINDLRTYFLTKFESTNMNANQAFEKMRIEATPKIPSKYKLLTNKDTVTALNLESVSVLQSLGGVQGSILQLYKGEYEKDNYTIQLNNRVGSDRGFKITYGKNLTGLEVDIDTSNVLNGIYPFYKDDEENIIEIPDKILYFETAYENGHIEPMDFSDEKPVDVMDLLNKAQAYVNSNKNRNEPTVSVNIEMIDLSQHPDYEQFVDFEIVTMGDDVTVYHPEYDVLTARVVAFEYDTLTDEYTKITIGSVKSNFVKDTVSNQQTIEDWIKNRPTPVSRDWVNQIVDHQTDLITGANGGYVLLDPKEQPYRILIMDSADKDTAKNVLQLNQNGIGFSKTGINGQYTTAWTLDSVFNADFIRAGSIKGESLEINLDMGTVEFTEGRIFKSNGDFEINISDGWLYSRGLYDNPQVGGSKIPISVTLDKAKLNFTHININQEKNYGSVEPHMGGARKSVIAGQDNASRISMINLFTPTITTKSAIITYGNTSGTLSTSNSGAMLRTNDYFSMITNPNKVNGYCSTGSTPSTYSMDRNDQFMVGAAFSVWNGYLGGNNSVDRYNPQGSAAAYVEARNQIVLSTGYSRYDNNLTTPAKITMGWFYNDDYTPWGIQPNTTMDESMAKNASSITMQGYNITANVQGSFSVIRGTKNASVMTRQGLTSMSAVEAPEVLFMDRGTSCVNELYECWVDINEIYSDTINLNYGYDVQLTAYGNAHLWVEEMRQDKFLVRSDKPFIRFSWLIFGKRIGYEETYAPRTFDGTYESDLEKYGYMKYDEVERKFVDVYHETLDKEM